MSTKQGARAEGGAEAVKEVNSHEVTRNKGFGRVVSMLGILVALTGLLTPGDVGPLGLAGVLLGALGFFLGAHRLGPAAVVLSWAEILLGVMMS